MKRALKLFYIFCIISAFIFFIITIINVYLNFFNKSGENKVLKSYDKIESLINSINLKDCGFEFKLPQKFTKDDLIYFKISSKESSCEEAIYFIAANSFESMKMKKKFMRLAAKNKYSKEVMQNEDGSLSFNIQTVLVEIKKNEGVMISFKNLNLKKDV